jgi:MFS family permease
MRGPAVPRSEPLPPGPLSRPAATPRPGRVARRTTSLLVAATALCYLSIGCYAAVLPGYVLHHLHDSTTTVGLAMGASAVFAVVLRPAAGGLGDRFGRPLPALLGGLVLALGPALLLGPRGILLVIVARSLVGVGDALFTTATMAWAIDLAPGDRPGRAMATLGMSIWLGLALGPQGAVAARDLGGYPAVWTAALVAPLLAGLLTRLVPAPTGSARPASDRPVSARPVVPRGAVRPALVMLLACYGNGVFEAFGIVHLTARGVSGGAGLGGAASVFTVIAVTTFLARFAGGSLADRVSPRAVSAVAVAVIAGAYLILAAASSFAAAAAGGAVLGVGQALLYPALGVIVSRQVPEAQRGSGIGVFLASVDAAFGLGPVVGGFVAAASSTTTALWTAAAVALMAIPLILLGRAPQTAING